jgi:hypothetical protein
MATVIQTSVTSTSPELSVNKKIDTMVDNEKKMTIKQHPPNDEGTSVNEIDI